MTPEEEFKELKPLMDRAVALRYPRLIWSREASKEDCLQFVQISMWELWDRYDPEKASRKRWVAFKASKLVIDYHRKVHGRLGGKRKAKEVPSLMASEVFFVDQTTGPQVEVDRKLDTTLWVQRVMTELRAILPKKFLSVVVLYYLDGLTMKQIGERESRTESAIYHRFTTRIWPAMKDIRERFRVEYPDAEFDISCLLCGE